MATNSPCIRIASFNIAGGMGPDILKMNEQLSHYHVDIVGIQEIDYFNQRNNFDMLKSFADLGRYPYFSFQKSIDFEDGEYGIGLLSCFEILKQDGGTLNSSDILEARAWQRILIKVKGKEVAIYNTHLTHEGQLCREVQMRQIIAIMNNDKTPYKILTGDFNTDQDNKEIYPMLEYFDIANGYRDNWLDTYNQRNEGMCAFAIDNIIVTRNIKIKFVGMVENSLSDHNMLYADVELGE